MPGSTAERHTIQYGTVEVPLLITLGKRKRMRISVHPDQSVTVDAPDDRDIEYILAKVRQKADWIVRQRDYFDRFRPLPTERRYVSGETHLYLGRQYRLKVIPEGRHGVKLIRGYLQVRVTDAEDRAKVKDLLDRWYLRNGRRIMLDRLHRCFEAVERFGIPYPSDVRFRRMKKRWGSCTKAGRITLNTELIKAPTYCIEYVIAHELCHLKHPHHGKEFYSLLTQCMPDWEKRKERLERVV